MSPAPVLTMAWPPACLRRLHLPEQRAAGRTGSRASTLPLGGLLRRVLLRLCRLCSALAAHC